VLNTPARLIETLSWFTLASAGATPAFKAEHCRRIAHVVRMLCATAETTSAAQETSAIIATYLATAVCLEGRTTYGPTGARYEAARDLGAQGRPVSLIDHNTGEYVIRVSDLAEKARRHDGASIPREWLDGRMSALGWQRVTVAGYELPGRAGRRGAHARRDVYRGHLPVAPDDESVNT